MKLFTGTRTLGGSNLSVQIQERLPSLVAALLPRLKVPEEYAVFSESEMHDVSIVDSVLEIQDAIIQRSQQRSLHPAASGSVFVYDLRRSAASALDAIASM